MELAPFASPAAQRRVLVDLLVLCFDRSRLGVQLTPTVLRPVIEAALDEMWRGRELSLEPLWAILGARPGLDLREAEAPLGAFAAFGGDLEVEIILPRALGGLPPGRLAELRDQLHLDEGHVRMMRLHQRKAVERSARAATATQAPPARPVDPAAPHPEQGPGPAPVGEPRRSPGLPSVARARGPWLGLALLGLGVAVAGTVAVAAPWLRASADVEPSTPCEVGDVEAIVHLEGGRCDGEAMAARVADAKWASLSPYQRQRLALRVFDVEARKGVRLLKLSDESAQQVVVDDRGGRKRVAIR